MDSVSASQQPTTMQCIGAGVKRTIGMIMPVYGGYTNGNTMDKLSSSVEQLDSFKKGDVHSVREESGVVSKTVKGTLKSALYALPFIGTAMLGKAKNELKQAQADVEAIKNGETPTESKKTGFFKNLETGIFERAKYLLPGYGLYYLGKQVKEIDNLAKDVDACTTYEFAQDTDV